MNSVDRVLYEELTHLMDRLATSVPEGSLSAVGHPLLRTRLDEADAQLAAARASLLEDYGRWRRRWKTSRISGRWPRGAAQPRRKRRASRPPRGHRPEILDVFQR